MYPEVKPVHARPTAEDSINPVARSIGLCALVLVLEPIVMSILMRSFPLLPFQQGLAGGGVILAFLVPGLYFGLIRPFQRQIRYGRQLSAGLEATQKELVERSAELSSANTKLHGSLLKLERRHNELVVLREMGALLQACTDVNEAEDLLKIFSQKLFPEESGAVYLYRSSRNLLERTVAWGESAYAMSLEPEDCWALRCGEAYSVSAGEAKPICRHNQGRQAQSTLCIPLSAQGEMAGLLLLAATAGAQGEEGSVMCESIQSLAVATGQKVALTLSNLQLQEKLRNQAIRDMLTGLYNRRYFEESFEREIKRAERSGSAVGLMMIDIDHFKKFNDAVGHQGGDVVLQQVGNLIREASREEDIPCRYGGEEFALMLSEMPLDALVERAEELRESIASLQASRHGQIMKGVTISCGVAVYPQHGTEPQELIRAADAALYEAKRQGRNRVVVARTDQLEPLWNGTTRSGTPTR